MTFYIIPGILPMLQVTSQSGSSHMRLGSRKLCSQKRIPFLIPNAVTSSSPIINVESVDPIGLHPSILPSKPIINEQSDSDKEMVLACASQEGYVVKLLFLTTYLVEKQFLYLLYDMSAFFDFNNQIVRYDNSYVHVQWPYTPYIMSALQITLFED